jgi:hypothetical protein
VQRFRQAEPSWLRSGQTTTLFSSDTEKDPVSEARGGITTCMYPRGAVRGIEGCKRSEDIEDDCCKRTAQKLVRSFGEPWELSTEACES